MGAQHVKDRFASEFLAIPWLAIAAKMLECSTVVWEPVDGGKLRVYENGGEVSLYLEKQIGLRLDCTSKTLIPPTCTFLTVATPAAMTCPNC